MQKANYLQFPALFEANPSIHKILCALNTRTDVSSCTSKAFTCSGNPRTELCAFHLHLEPAKFEPTLSINTSWICSCVIKLTEIKWKLQGEFQTSSPLINQSVWKFHPVILLPKQWLCRVWDAQWRSCKDLCHLTGGFHNYPNILYLLRASLCITF